MSDLGYDGVIVDIITYVYRTEVKSELALGHARWALLDTIGCE